MRRTSSALSTLRIILAPCIFCLALAFTLPAGSAGQSSVTDKLKNLEFREIGPAVMGGRIDDFGVVESNPNIVYVGTASGGVWKTTNNGTTWEPIFDKEAFRRSGTLPSRLLIRGSCGWARESRTTGKALRGEMESTSRWMLARRGR